MCKFVVFRFCTCSLLFFAISFFRYIFLKQNQWIWKWRKRLYFFTTLLKMWENFLGDYINTFFYKFWMHMHMLKKLNITHVTVENVPVRHENILEHRIFIFASVLLMIWTFPWSFSLLFSRVNIFLQS